MFNFEDLLEYPDLTVAKQKEQNWLQQTVSTGNTGKSWAQYHAGENRDVPLQQGTNVLLPLIRDKVNTLDMQYHIMKLNIKAVEALNPGQTPVDVSDQPVYALTKEVQYRFAEEFHDYFAMFVGLHIEQCLLKIHGQLIAGNGLPEVLNQCSLATTGLDAVVDVNHIKRARYCVQVI